MNHRSDNAVSQRFSHRGKERHARRGRILEAAEVVFATRGYHEASIIEIARRAELAAGTIYLYFGDKADLYGNVVSAKMKEVAGQVQTALSSDRSAKACLCAAAHALFAYYDSNRSFFELFLYQHQLAASPLRAKHWSEMEDLKRRHLRLVEECVVRGQASGEIRAGNPRFYAVAFLGVTLQMVRQWIREGGERRLTESADFAADCFLHGAATPSCRPQLAAAE